jgi:NTP pyrophosphatase (non-canonical NTP hydrolase)
MLNELATRTADAMKAQGFRDGPEGESVPTMLALIHSEISEALEEVRKPNQPIDLIYYRPSDGKPEGFVIELADAIIRIADLAGVFGLDLEAAIAEKEAFNATRPRRHGKAFYLQAPDHLHPHL